MHKSKNFLWYNKRKPISNPRKISWQNLLSKPAWLSGVRKKEHWTELVGFEILLEVKVETWQQLTSNSVIQVETLDAAAAGVGGNSEVTITILFTTNFYICDRNSIAFGSKHSIYDRILDDIILDLYERRILEFSKSSTTIIMVASS